MLSRKFRLRKKEEVERVFHGGLVAKNSLFLLKYLPSEAEHPRAAVIVGKKIEKSAARRNRIRRRLREIVRLHFDKLPNVDLLVIARTSKIREIDFRQLETEFFNLIAQFKNG